MQNIAPPTTRRLSRQESETKAAEHGDEEGTEFWPPFYGYRLKITDTFVAAFTALLFFATLALWLSTRNLVRGADKTAERQLRAYLSIEPVSLRDFVAGRRPMVVFIVKNIGQTPAHRVRIIGDMDIFPHPLINNQPDLVIPDPNAPIPTRALHPTFTFEAEAVLGRLLTSQDVMRVYGGVHYCLYVFGIVIYEDAFGEERRTKFCCYVGGHEFARVVDQAKNQTPGVTHKIHWDFAVPHNEAT
jgi:hypothetical protein